ncbi:MAG: NAD(P)-dependent oxidoreductase [Planctomycetota bacterium]|nr:NAD(P)-dependent oxidoreductase [Planctomycetota bacterium]
MSPTTATDPSPVTDTSQESAIVLIADKFDATGIEELENLGHVVISDPGLDPSTLPAAIAEHDPHVLIVRSTRVKSDSIAAAGRLSLIVRAGAGTDNIDVAAASGRGIPVANCPGKNSLAVAELAWGLILACDRRIPDQVADLRAGAWNKKEYGKASGLAGRTLGIVGLGRIGEAIADRGNAFGMRVFAWSRNISEARAEAAGCHACENLENLARMSDVVCVSVAANADTEKLIGREFLDAMKPGATIVNTSRGSVIDENALVEAIRAKGLRAGLDVYEDEPGSGTGEFHPEVVSLPGVYGSHHVGASTDQAQAAIASEAVRIVRDYLQRGRVPNCINLASGTGAATVTVRHLNRPGVLATICEILGRGELNIEDMENVIFTGGEAASVRIRVSKVPGSDLVTEIASRPNVLSIDVTAH